MKNLVLTLFVLVTIPVAPVWVGRVDAACVCPFCDAPALMLSEQIGQCDHLLRGKWLEGEKPISLRGGSSTFEIVDVAFSKGDRFQKGQIVVMPQYVAGSEASTFSLMGPDERLEDWHVPAEVTDTAWTYLSKMPPAVKGIEAQAKRLLFFLDYFEHSDVLVSNDAFAEFAAAPYEVIKPLKDDLPREKILGWLQDPKTPVTRTGFYGMLAGICGKPEDAPILEQKIVTLDADFRLGIEGVMAGYMMIRGEEGLRKLEEVKIISKTAIDKDGKEIKLPFSETYAVMQALRFMWTYEPERLSKDRLKQAMHLLLERKEMADLVITDLARWKDWSIQDRLMTMYTDENFDIPAIRRAIVRYLYYCSQEQTEPGADGSRVPTAEAIKAEANMKLLEERDPKTVNDAKRYLIR
ncbi:MAG: hypothetical protein R3C17_11430 [Planctomycetaceae bacterium]